MCPKTAKRERADRLMLEQGLAETRSQAQALLLAGRVYFGERRVEKPGSLWPNDTLLSLRGTARFVSRGGLKLEGALSELHVDVNGFIAADIGASTGGFTDCLLQRGARKVYAIDVGHGQLAASLRADPRVVVMERVNARHLEADSLGELVNLVVVDASFISLEKLLAALIKLLEPRGLLLALIKPQFEVGRREASKHKGVIRDETLRATAILSTLEKIRQAGFEVLAECASSVKGPKGNLEHFVLARLVGR